MNIDYQVSDNSSILDVTLHNMSLDMTSNDIRNPHSTNKKSHNESRMLDFRRIDKIDPQKDLNDDELDAFLLF